MKSLSDYTSAFQTQLFNDTSSFFAFGMEQFNEAKKKNVKYTSVGAGLYTPSDNVKELLDGLDTINKNGIQQDIAENSIKGIIHRELANYETQISGDISPVVSALEDYNITQEDIIREYKEFYQCCIDNDYF